MTSCVFETDTRRLESVAFESVEHRAVTRPSLALSPREGPAFETIVSAVGEGSFVAHLALRGATSHAAGARLELVAGDWLTGLLHEDPGACEVGWAEDANAPWQRCEIPIAKRYASLRLAVHYDGPLDSELLLAAPIFEDEGSRAARPPVFLIVLDTARVDGYRSFNRDTPVGANLAELERDGIVFTRARSTSGWTRTAVASLLTGRSPFAHDVLGRFDVLGPESTTLGRVLQDAGYVTRAWSTNPNVLERWGFAQGFDAFEDLGSRVWATVKPDGARVLDQVEAALARDGAAGRLFYIHLMDPHQPYQPQDASLIELDRITGSRYALPRHAAKPARTRVMREHYREYQGELLETDQQVGRLLESLRRRGEYDGALIAVVSDHGEEFLDHMGGGHGKTLYEEMIRVPLWLKLPRGLHAGTRVEHGVDLSDLLPTLLAVLELPVPASSEGRNVLEAAPAGAEPSLHVSRLALEGRDLAAVVQENWKLLLDLGTSQEWLYDLESDPKERVDVLANHPERASRLRAAFESRHFEYQRGWHVRGCGGADEDDLAFSLIPETEGIVLRTRRFEDADRIETEGAATRVSLSLLPRVHPTEGALRAKRPTFADEDELLIAAPDGDDPPAFLLQSAGGAIAHRFGTGRSMASAAEIRSATRLDDARVPAGHSVRCDSEVGPYLHLWFVEPPRRDAREVAPDLSERLRALGYGR